jgi:hypothetical protein
MSLGNLVHEINSDDIDNAFNSLVDSIKRVSANEAAKVCTDPLEQWRQFKFNMVTFTMQASAALNNTIMDIVMEKREL